MPCNAGRRNEKLPARQQVAAMTARELSTYRKSELLPLQPWTYHPRCQGQPDCPALSGDNVMNLSAPTMPVFLIAAVLFLLALIGHFVVIPFVTMYQFWLAIIAFIVLALGNLLKGM
jgi:hypothetical protein